MTQTAWVLSLTQFYLGLGFMLFFLALELGLAWVLFVLRLRAGREAAALLAYRFWVRIYALALIIGFAASLPLLLQLGTLWPDFMDRAGEVAGPLLAMAILTTFVFKSCFLGAMLYGQRPLSDRAHTTVVGMVALGTSLTAWWIVVLLAWLQWPVGATLTENHYQISSWAALLGGAAPALFGVLVSGGLMLAATLMLSITAQRTRSRPSDEGDRAIFAGGARLLLLALVLQIGLAAWLGSQLLPVQPARVAAVVPQWQSGPVQPLSLLAWLDVPAGRNAWVLAGPPVPSGWLSGAAATDAGAVATLPGLNDLMGMRPPVWLTYASSRLAVFLTGLLALMALVAWWRGRRLGFEPDSLTDSGRVWLQGMAWTALVLQAVGWGHLLVGSLPYAIYGTVTLREIGTVQALDSLWLVLGVQVLVYGALALGFRQLLGHTMRYGVVPVARHRGRA
ncbi:cytochrome ubiquinol oxidase subunit I [Castellaniella sp.]|uniref:cytochrome ubiquinol oxidase subunit I n=1 Tax=Castellaniella sp. TaxID=1955812 RepID=UPI002AFE0DA7|nr:cytochrome ubiquinol oxidase subunit I [Castellaniella sp.]